MAYVYKHIRLDTNQPFYIGIGKSDTDNFKRAYSNKNRNVHWKNIVKKIEYKIEILIENITWEEACEKEKELIKFFGIEKDKSGILTNLNYGGEGGIIWVGDHPNKNKKVKKSIKKKISQTVKKLWKDGVYNTPEAKKSRSLATSKRFKGRSLKESTKKKISKTVKKLHKIGFYSNPEILNKKSKSMIGKNKGKNCSEETRQKLRDARKRTEEKKRTS